ncbi:MAG: Ig-like domain-containing protein [Verrucomicrobiales bacterium]
MKPPSRIHVLVRCLLALAFCGGSVTSAEDFYVDPVSGKDTNNGTSLATAFKTLEKARAAVDAINGSMTEDITVHLRGGIHRLSAMLTLDPGDSGTNGFNVVYRNYGSEVPVISGGVDLSGGWVLHDATKNIYKKTGVNFPFRQLTVNASSAIRARLPNQNAADPYFNMIGIDAAAKEAIVHRPDVEGWRSITGLSNVEVVMHPHWYQYRGRVDDRLAADGGSYQNETQVRFKFQSPENGSIFAKGDSFWDSLTYPVPYFVENSIDFLDAEGEWFHDTASSTLYYKPRTGEYMPTATIEAPKLERLIQISGTSSSTSGKVRNVRFEGLTFTQTGWNGPSTKGSAMSQGARELISPFAKHGAITAQYAENVDIAFCKFRFLGFTAISYVKGVTGGAIRNCDFRWLSGNGIVIHEDGDQSPAAGEECQNIRIVNNGISRFGQQYSNGVGIVSYFVKRMLIADNEISYGPYMGTQTGGQAGGNEEAGMKDNILRNNYVHHVMQFHDDGAAFYTLARQQGTHIVDNWADTIQWAQLTGAYPVAGIYADNYSEFITFERNANVNCSDDINQNTSGGVQNIRLISNVTTADTTITDYAGRKSNYVMPTKVEAENMTITTGTAESGVSAYSNDAGVTFSANGRLTTTFTGAAGTYNLHAAYITGSSAAASYVLRVNGTSVDSWSAELTPAGTGLQIRHRIKRAVTLPAGAEIRLDVTPVSGTPAKVDYVEVYGRQEAGPLAPESLTANAASATKIALAWEGWTGGTTSATYSIFRATSLAGPFTSIAAGVNGTTWMDSHLVQGTPYFYKVTMTTAQGTSPDSAVASATPQALSGIASLESSADAYVRAGSSAAINFGTATQLVVKNATTADNYRKAYIRFDLTGHDPKSTPNASLQFMVESAWNDTTPWQVYGLKDADAGESWGESTITWNNAPANTTTSGDGLTSSRVTLLGTLAATGPQPLGNILELRSAALDSFLLADTDNKVTFILTRASTASGNSIVASKEHATIAAPTLEFDRLVLEDNANTQRYETSTTATTNTISNFTVPDGSYRKLVLTASWENANPGISATWKGTQNFTVAVNSAGGRNSAILYLDDPATGSGNIVVTFAAATQSRVGVLSLAGAARGVARTSTTTGLTGNLIIPVNGSLVTGVYTSNNLPSITGPFASTLHNGDSGSSAGNAGYQIVPTAGSANYTWTVSAPSGDNNALAVFVPSAAAPVITTTSPADDATGVLVNANLVATFTEPVVKGTGTITLRKTSDNSILESFDAATSSRLTFSGQTLTIDPTNNLATGTGYYALIPSTAIIDSSGGHAFAGISSATAWNFTTDFAPTLVSLAPADNATGVLVDANLVATFSEPVVKGTGTITLRKTSDNSIVESFDAATSSRLTFSGQALTIDPTNNLATGTGYYALIPSTSVIDTSAGNAFAGISSATAWDFTTDFAPTLVSLAPADDATGVLVDANLVATFSEPVVKGTGTITLRKTSDNSIVESFDVVSSTRLTFSGSTLTINPTANLDYETGYCVIIDATAVIDTSGGNAFAGISAPSAWNFTSALPTFSDWISNPAFGLAPADRDLADDPEGDGIDNGVESFFGTHPVAFTQGLTAGIKNGSTFTFTHPQGSLPAGLTASYRWSTDLATFHLGGATSGGTTVNFTTEANTPAPGFTRVTATVTGTLPARLFVDVRVTGP